jgi:thioredoxin-related protein
MKNHLMKSIENYFLKEVSLSKYLRISTLCMSILVLIPTTFVVGQITKRGPLKPSSAQLHPQGAIKWLTMEEAYKASKVIDKPLFIDVYTSWCGWCKRMDQTTFQDPVVAAYINANFHPVKFDAETKDTIQFFDRTYTNSQATYVGKVMRQSDSTIQVLNDSIKLLGSDDKNKVTVASLVRRIQETKATKKRIAKQGRRTTHDLAREVMNNQMSYPTFVLLFDSLKTNFPIKGYQKPNQLLSILSFFGEKVHFKTRDLAGYQKMFFNSFSETTPVNNLGDFSATLEKARVSKKKSLLLVTNDQFYTSQVFERGCIASAEIQAYLGENFEVGKFNLHNKDSINFNGQVFKNVNGIHQLPIALMQNQVKFPSMVFLDEDQKLIMSIPDFFLPVDLLPIFHFIEEEAYKVGDYATFRKGYEKNKNNTVKVGQ